ncbi:MAG: GTP cyclohydrolase I FolE [Dehalogenimonas sp.]|uniref:GTP cyclohydrolase 1 n=1 Tax=Candidatus Dehalogenimonas loeffleri TaxID=3127115 RepID=A0ABZ2J3S3_9CHLR|nr:GTP cyclohydrolase I FolE [Dehalogenimonas sp.]
MIDEKAIAAAVKTMLQAIGDDPEREGLRETPERVARMYTEIFAGIDKNPADDLKVGYELGHREMVILKDIPFHSMCEHHLLPFSGVVHIGYVPGTDGRVVGISKLARVVETVARRPQIQERMATEIADAIVEGLNPDGVGVVIAAEHMCMTMRGIKKPGSKVLTSALRGGFAKRAATRAEFMSLIQ